MTRNTLIEFYAILSVNSWAYWFFMKKYHNLQKTQKKIVHKCFCGMQSLSIVQGCDFWPIPPKSQNQYISWFLLVKEQNFMQLIISVNSWTYIFFFLNITIWEKLKQAYKNVQKMMSICVLKSIFHIKMFLWYTITLSFRDMITGLFHQNLKINILVDFCLAGS